MLQHTSNALMALSLVLPIVLAGPHSGFGSHKRHHARDILLKQEELATRRECSHGDWQCVGSELQRCNWDSWVSIADCTGDDVVCSADPVATGCIWSWSLESGQPVSANESLPVIVVSSTSAAVESATSTTSVDISSTTDEAPSSTTDFVQSTSGAEESSTTVNAIETEASTTNIGGALYVGQHGGGPRRSSSTQNWYDQGTTQDWYGASSSTEDWDTEDWATASVTASSTTQDWYTQPTTTTSSAGWDDGSWSAPSSSSSSRRSRTSSTSAAATSKPTGGGTSSSPSGSFSAPHYVIYSDQWLTQMPAASDLSSYNRFILAFWMAQPGAVDNAQAWEGWSDDYRQQVLDEYHEAGIALMVSAFGATDAPTSSGADPTATAQKLAAWVKQYGLDGVDIDYEDMDAMNGGSAEAWLVTFQTELRAQLPAPYLISHAPVAPWFTSGNNYPNGAYVKVHEATGSGINFYNVQFYNQGTDVYTNCDSLISGDGSSSWPGTSVFGINAHANVPLDKIVIGKPIDSGAAANGYMDGSDLAGCVAIAQSQGWNGGVMFWEWTPSIAPSLMATVRTA